MEVSIKSVIFASANKNKDIMKKVIYVRCFPDGMVTRNEKTCESFDDLIRTFDECVGSFRDFCKEYGDFTEEDLSHAEGNAMGISHRVKVIDA